MTTQRSGFDDASGSEITYYKAKSALADSITNASIDSLVALDPDLNILSWNKITEVWSSLKRDEVLGRHFFDVFPSASATPRLREALQQALKGNKTFLPSAPGFYLEGFFETHFVPLEDEDGHINGVLQIIHDVAHRVKAENLLKELNTKLKVQFTALQHANEEMVTFGKIAAHDLKEPLRKIYSFSEYIKVHEAGHLTDSGKGYFRRIQRSVQRMGLLTDDIVNFLSLSGSERLQTVNLSIILSDAIGNLRNEIELTGAEIGASSLPQIKGYPKALSQIFKQVLGNALKFCHVDITPQIRVGCDKIWGSDIGCNEARQDEEYYHIFFSDNGIGFRPEYETQIFWLFERLHPQGTYKGTGMGLALALKAARMHGGFMKARSRPGKGSTFHLYIPVSGMP